MNQDAAMQWKSFLERTNNLNCFPVSFQNAIWLFQNGCFKLLCQNVYLIFDPFNLWIILPITEAWIFLNGSLSLRLTKRKHLLNLFHNLISAVITHQNWKHVGLFFVVNEIASVIHWLLMNSLNLTKLFLKLIWIFFLF